MKGRPLHSHGGYGLPENDNKTLRTFQSDTLETGWRALYSSCIGNGVTAEVQDRSKNYYTILGICKKAEFIFYARYRTVNVHIIDRRGVFQFVRPQV